MPTMHWKNRKSKSQTIRGICFILLTLTPSIIGQSFELTFTIDEEVPVGTLIGYIGRDSNVSRLLSVEDYNSLRFQLSALNSDKSDYFKVDETTGALTVAKTIDREQECYYEIKCELTIHVSAQTAARLQFYSFTVHVNILDVNDNTPRFRLGHMSLQIDEDAPKHSTFPINAAVDGDILNNTVQRYMLKVPSDVFDLQVSRNLDDSLVPQLYVKSTLDRETKPYYFLQIVALDGGTPRRTGEMSLNVTLNDVNDNPPKFSQRTYDVFVEEVAPIGYKIATLTATDLDTGKNGMIRFRLGRRQSEVAFNSFKIDAVSGAITTLQDLTEYQGKTLKLVVEAEDNGNKPQIAQAQVNIHVQDTVNNAPRISFTYPDSNSRRTSVPENATMGLVVAHFLVKDTDDNEQGEVECKINNPDNPFSLYQLAPKEYKVSVHGPLDRETTPSYIVSLTCADKGGPPQFIDFDYQISVSDINDQAPKFNRKVYEANITENADSNYVLRVKAMDEDAPPNNAVRYQLGNVTSLVRTYIEVSPSTGDISTKKPLDRELASKLEFIVEAIDSGQPPLSSSCMVIINVLDQNDNRPTITKEKSVLRIRENMPVGTVVGQIEANDPDEGPSGQISYQLLTDNDATKYFNLSYIGVLSTLKVFDREAKDHYDINVVAKDYGLYPKTNILHIRIEIADDNDHRPIFEFPRIGSDDASVTLNARPNTTVARIIAKDDDIEENATLTYTIIDGASDLFEIEPHTGRIYTLRRLYTRDKGEYLVSLFVRDNGPFPRSTTSTVTLNIRQGNYTAASTGSNKTNHIVIAVILVGATVFIAIIVLIIVIRVIRKDRRDRRAKYTGGLPMQVKNHSPTMDDESDEGPWRRYDDAKHGNGPTVVTADGNDDIMMFKMKMGDQYRELEPEEKERIRANSLCRPDLSPRKYSDFGGDSRKYSDFSAMDGAPDVTRSKSTTRLATFQTNKLSPYNTDGKDKVWRAGLKDKMTDEILSSSSRETSGADSGRGPSEDGSQSCTGVGNTFFFNDEASGGSKHTAKLQFHQCATNGPTLLMTFQTDGKKPISESGNFDPRQESPYPMSPNSSPLPGRRGISPIPSRGTSPLPGRHGYNLGFNNLGSNVSLSHSTGNLSNSGMDPSRKMFYPDPTVKQVYTDDIVPYTSLGMSYSHLAEGMGQGAGAQGYAIGPEQFMHTPPQVRLDDRMCTEAPRGVQESTANLYPHRPMFVTDDMFPQGGNNNRLMGPRIAFGTSCPQLFVDDPSLMDPYSQPFFVVANRSRSFYNQLDPNMQMNPQQIQSHQIQQLQPQQIQPQQVQSQQAPSAMNSNNSRSYQNLMNESADTTLDDANTTTTSGSYTIDQDETCVKEQQSPTDNTKQADSYV